MGGLITAISIYYAIPSTQPLLRESTDLIQSKQFSKYYPLSHKTRENHPGLAHSIGFWGKDRCDSKTIQ